MVTFNSHPIPGPHSIIKSPGILIAVMCPLFLVAPSLWAQIENGSEITAQEPELSMALRVERNLVGVRVIVRDKAGRLVDNLKSEDFALFDNGKTQTITHFSIERRLPPREATPDETGQAQPPAPASQRFLALVFDDLHAGHEELRRIAEVAGQYLQTAMRPGDHVGIFTTSGLGQLEFSSDLGEIRTALLHLSPRPVHETRPCPDIPPYQAYLIVERFDPEALEVARQQMIQECGTLPKEGAWGMEQGQNNYVQSKARQILVDSQIEARQTFDAIDRVVMHLTERAGERTMVLASPGFYDRTVDYALDPVIDRALRENIVVNALSTRGLEGESLFSAQPKIMQRAPELAPAHRIIQEVLDTNEEPLLALVTATGGTFFRKSNDFLSGFRSTAELAEVYYLLAFTPSDLKYDGQYHPLKVKLVNDQAFSVQARRGYYALRAPLTESQQAEEQIRYAIFSTGVSRSVPMVVSTKFFKTEAQRARLTVQVRVDPRALTFRDEQGKKVDVLRITTVVFDNEGKLVDGKQRNLKMRLNEPALAKLRELPGGVQASIDLDLAPGNYRLREIVFDSNSGNLGTINQALEIPF